MAVLEGIDELDAKLKRLDLTVRAKMLMTALKKNVEPTRAGSAQRAPVLTGNLATHQAIATVPSLSNALTAVVRVGPERKAFYGTFDEFGTKFMGKQPFLGPAFEETKEEVLKKTAEDFKATVENFQ
jgi:HK97 gp10 family phage protein